MRGLPGRSRPYVFRRLRASVLALLAASSPDVPTSADAPAFAESASTPEAAQWPRVLIADPYTKDCLLSALQDAAERLGQPACRTVLSDFTARDGRPLEEKLGEVGATPADYLQLILFQDGSDSGPCRNPAVMAFTSPGSRVVSVCGRQFQLLWRREPWGAPAIVIHEALHTLGLGENPPSSAQITHRVRSRCTR
jgi:hypothetical protein